MELILTQSAQFYEPNSSDSLTDVGISDLLASACSNKPEDHDYIASEFRTVREVGNISYVVSFRIYITQRPVYFIKGNEYQDRIHALIVLLEINNHLVIIRKSCAPFQETLDKYFTRVPYSKFSASIESSARFQKISLRNLTVSDRAVRNKSFEAFDLNGVLSTHTAPWSIPYYLKIKDREATKTITTGSSRITEYSSRKELDEIAAWASDQIYQLNDSSSGHAFLSQYAIPIELSEVLKETDPSAILIEVPRLMQLLEDENKEIYWNSKKNVVRKYKSYGKKILFRALEKVYEIEEDIVLGIASTKIQRNKDSLTFNSYPFHKYLINHKESHITLQKFIIENSLYSICFRNPAYMYYLGSCFKENARSGGIESIMQILSSKKELLNVNSEKGKVTAASKKFSVRSLFGVVERLFGSADYLFCDDLGIEWADHIALSKTDPSISFIHSKHKGDTSTSASNLHDVTGQAIKNMGNMFFSAEELIEKKRDKFSSLYGESSISRRRKGRVSSLSSTVDEMLSRPQLHRKCILVCSFLSKKDLSKALKQLKENPSDVKGHVIQLYWILSSFIHASKEMSIVPEIICKP
jgi:hypothetical protein